MSITKIAQKLNETYSTMPMQGKHPVIKGWSTRCVEKAVYDAKEYSNVNNVGIACGPASGILVLDIDDHDLFKTSQKIEGWEIPVTKTIRTGRGGLHYYYRYPNDGYTYGNRSSKSKGFDIRGKGGVVVAPGSVHPGSGRKYKVEIDVPEASAPEWLLHLARKNDEDKQEIRAVDKSQLPEDVDLNFIDIAPKIKDEIVNGAEKGERSEAIWRVLQTLISSGLSDRQIVWIFEEHLIGEKYREKGKFEARARWIEPQIEKARKIVKEERLRPSSEEIIEAFQRSEEGDAELFVRLFNGKYCYDKTDCRWYKFNGISWEPDYTDETLKAINNVAALYENEAGRRNNRGGPKKMNWDFSITDNNEALVESLLKRSTKLNKYQRRKHVLTLAAAGGTHDSLAITGKEWDSNPWKLGCSNGIIDLKTGEFSETSPQDFIRTVSPASWIDLDEPALAWKEFILGIFNDNQDLVDYMQRLLGYSLIGQVLEHVLPVLWGQGRNGKSTLFNCMKLVLGDLSSPIPSETLLNQNFSRSGASHNADLFLLKGRRLVWTSEIGDGRYFDSSTVKRLTGGDDLVARQCNARDFETFLPSHTLMLLTNTKPHIHDASDYALFQRLHLIPFEVSFVPEPVKDFERKADLYLMDRLKDEASGILAWMVKGCLAYQDQGLNPPDIILEATKEYQTEEDTFGHFLESCCEIGDGRTAKASELYKAYQGWCKENGHYSLSSTKFHKTMRSRFNEFKSGVKKYRGVKLVEDTIISDF